jgi:RNA polymerase sigma factor (TIGR02999 family)
LRRAADDPDAVGDLVSAAFGELRAIARRRLRNERADHTLQPTALVNEVYLRLFSSGDEVRYANRAHFFSAAAETMRHILLEHARNRGRQKRGGGRQRVPLAMADVAFEADRDDVEAVDAALRKLEARDAALAQIVKLRFYAGLNHEEIAEALGSSERTIRREWKLAEAFLARELARDFKSD